MRRQGAACVVAACCAMGVAAPATAQPSPCAAVQNDQDRLRCYDAAAQAKPGPPSAKPVAAKEDPFIVAGKARVKTQLLDADSARFQNIKIKMVEGAKGLCGEINAKNASGGMTGFIPWAYDGQYAYILSFNQGPGNPTSLTGDIWSISMGSRLKAHDKWCK